MGWRSAVVLAQEVIIQGGGGGAFVYDAAGNLRESIAGAATTDPVHGLPVPAGTATYNAFGAVVNLLSTANDAFFQYNDTGSAVQGGLILAVASTAGNDPVTSASYLPGLNGINPVFGDFLLAVGSRIDLGTAVFTQNGQVSIQQGSGATSPGLFVFAPEQGQSGHLVMLMQGTSPDGTHLGQLLIAREVTGFTGPTPVTSSLIEFQSPTALLGDPLLTLVMQAAADNTLGVRVVGDTNNRLRVDSNGQVSWGPGSATQDCILSRQAANILQVLTADLDIATAGKGLRIKEGANARMGTATLVAGTAVVANTSVTGNTRIFYAVKVPGGAQGFLHTTQTAGTGFSIISTSGTETSTVVWLLVEPG